MKKLLTGFAVVMLALTLGASDARRTAATHTTTVVRPGVGVKHTETIVRPGGATRTTTVVRGGGGRRGRH